MRWSHAVSFDFQKILKEELIFSLELKSNNKRLSMTVVKEKKKNEKVNEFRAYFFIYLHTRHGTQNVSLLCFSVSS